MQYKQERRTSKFRIAGALLAWCCLIPGSRAEAASMLRCELDGGSVSFASTRIGNAKCSRVNLVWLSPALSSTTTAHASVASAGNSTSPTHAPSRLGSQPSSPSSIMPRVAGLPRRESLVRIYSYIADGVRHYVTNVPPGVAAGTPVVELRLMDTCTLCAPTDDATVAALMLDTRSYQREIDSAASTFGVGIALVRAVIHVESAYRPNVISRAGAQGLMQLMPATALRFGVHDVFDPQQNIQGGVQYLSWLLKRFNGNLDLALAAYNSGEAAVDKYNGVPPYDETRTYVSRVKMLAARYREGQ
jgi:hypothetical protein